jgi:hypothetical protein
MSELMNIVTNFSMNVRHNPHNEKSHKDARKHVYQRAVCHGLSMFFAVDMPSAKKFSMDQLRGLLYNRIRTNTYQYGDRPAFKKHTIRDFFITLNADKTDITRISLYRRSSNEEIFYDMQYVSEEEKFLAGVFAEINEMRSAKAYLRKVDIPDCQVSLVGRTYDNILSNYKSSIHKPQK